jgi:hypothetical protein
MMVASTDLDGLEGFGREFLASKEGAMEICQLELCRKHPTRVRQEGNAKPSSSILYGTIRTNTDLKQEEKEPAKQRKEKLIV